MNISVIIPTRNRADSLKKTIQSVIDNKYDGDYEIIIVDNGSSDNTKEVCEHFSKICSGLIYIYDERPGLHVGRNVGWKKAIADICAFLDDDVIVFPNWLSTIDDCFSDSAVGMLGGNDIFRMENGETIPEFIDELWVTESETGNRILMEFSCVDLGVVQKEIRPELIIGCNFIVRKDVLIQAGGFHPDCMPSELSIYIGDGETHVAQHCRKMGLVARFDPKASVYHVMPQNRVSKKGIAATYLRMCMGVAYSHYRKYGSRKIFNATVILMGMMLKEVANIAKFSLKMDKYKQLKAIVYTRGFLYYLLYFRKFKMAEWCYRDDYMDENMCLPKIQK